MDVAALLHQLQSPSALRQLIAALGHATAWEELPAGTLPDQTGPAVVVGRAGSFEWLALETHEAPLRARRLSVALARAGRLSGILALDRRDRSLTIAVAADRPALATFTPQSPGPGQLERLRRLLAAGRESGIGFALRAAEILSGEDAGRRFFLAFRAATDRMAAALPGPLSAEERQTLALVQLTRVLFLYFVQVRGWLDSQPDFLPRAVDDALARRRQLHRDLFRPLFFGTLNRPVDARGRARCFGRIPFLNGGLFEPHPLERRWRGEIPNLEWRDAFDRVFERFQFTVHEGGHPRQIAPDMLGRVFEGLMAPTSRRATGAFYTPAPLVAQLVDRALAAWLSARLACSPAAAQARLDTPDTALHSLLGSIALLDPAAGSGAFLLGALDRLAELQRNTAPPALLRRRILSRNLFGVDRNPMAVRLAELRLWLAVIAHEPDGMPEEVAPLPNLDGVVRTGDSLLDPAWFLATLGAVRAEREGPRLGQLREAFVHAAGPAKREHHRRLRQAEQRAFAECLRRAEAATEAELAEVMQSARAQTLFGERRGLDRALRRRLVSLRAHLREIRALARRLAREGGVPWFQYECHFGDILARGGFDLIVGNPPWVRAEELPARERAQLGRRYRWWRSGGPGFRHQPDLSVAFVERSTELLAPGGALALLLPLKLTSAGYGARCRAAVAERLTLHVVADLREEPAAAFDATTYPAALVATRAIPSPSHEVALALRDRPGCSVPQHQLGGGGPWALGAPLVLEIRARLAALHPALGERFVPQLGVKTGANAVFLDPPAELEPAVLATALRGRDIAPFRHRTGVPLFFPHDREGEPHRRLPPRAALYVQLHEALLRARVDYREGPPWTLFRVRPALAPHRVAWADLARQLNAVVLTGASASGIIPLNSCYLVTPPDRTTALALTAWLNSSWLRALARAVADVASGGFARFNARVVAGLPLPAAVLSDARLTELADRGAQGDTVQEEIDAIAARHLALSPAEQARLAAALGPRAADRGRGAG